MRPFSDFYKGTQTKSFHYLPVCMLFSERAGIERPVGSAVFIAPRLAITASHCVMHWQPNLSLRPVLESQHTFAVEGIIWEPDNGKEEIFRFADPYFRYPDTGNRKSPEGIVLLRLAQAIPADHCASFSTEGPDIGFLLEIAAADPVLSGWVRYATLRLVKLLGDTFEAMQHLDGGFARASGAPALAVDKSNRATVVGIQSSVRGSGLRPAESVAGVLLLTRARVQWITQWMTRPLPPLLEIFPVLDPPRRYIVVRERDSMVLSGGDVLLEHSDRDFFHGKAWNLLGCGTLGLLTSNGIVVTSRCDAQSSEYRIELFTFQRRQRSEFSLVPGGHDDVALWLHGWVCFGSRLVHVYLYRVENIDKDSGREIDGNIRIEAFELEGAYEDHAPEQNLIVYLRSGETIASASTRAAEFIAKYRRGLVDFVDPREFVFVPGPSGYVQDDVANGHEGHKSP